jgi:8-oxo-dGTP diphosphatase
MAQPRVAAGVLIRDEAGQILMVRPTYKDGWDIPGGYVEPDESPAKAAERELAEELNVTRGAGRLLVVDWAPHPAEGDKLLFVFDGGILSPHEISLLRPDAVEISEARFWHAEMLDELTPSRLARRLRLAIQAALTGVTIYAEHGTSQLAVG